MIKVIEKIKMPIYIQFIIYISIIEVFFSFFFNLLGFQTFQMIPYLRFVIIFFSSLFFSRLILSSNDLFSLRISNKSENILVLLWVFFTGIGIIIGILNQNPILYFITDLLYIIFGYIIYRIFLTDKKLINEIKIGLNTTQEKKLLVFFIFITILALLFSVELPSFIVVFSLVYSLYFYWFKKYINMSISIIPFFFQFLTANRAILLVFIFILFFSFSHNKFSKKNIIFLFLFLFSFFFLSSFFIKDMLKLVINILPENPNTLKDRLVQIYLIFSGKANWNSPSMLSLQQRIDEASLVLSFWFSNPMNFFFGGGMGATLEGYSFKDTGVVSSALLGKSAIHNIHLLPFSFLFRYGFFGLIIFLNIFYNFFKYFLKIITDVKSQFAIIVCFQFCWILYSFPAASYLWTCPFFWITLAYLSNENKIFNS
jgi:hypothetical protein